MKTTGLFLLSLLLLISCQEKELTTSDLSGNTSAARQSLWLIKHIDSNPATRAVGVKSKFWNTEDTIRIKFLNVNTDIQEKIKLYAAEWLEHACLFFKYVEPAEEADVKIGFNTEGRWVSWSTIGTDCKAIPQDEPSLNYVWWEDDPEVLIKSEILRGIGHVLGLGFEHQNPGSTLTFKPTADIAGEYNLSEEEVEEFKTLYTTDQSNYTDYDKNSVMTVTIGRGLVTRPNMATVYNSELSDNDKAFMEQTYPAPLMKIVFVGKDTWLCVGADYWVGVPGAHRTRIVDWGDGMKDSLLTESYYNHTYAIAGEYTIRFFGPDTAYQMLVNTQGGKSFDVSRNKELRTLYSYDGSLESLDVSHNPKLRILACENNNHPLRVDVSNNPLLEVLSLCDCKMDELNLDYCPELTMLYCINNSLTSFDFHNNSKLELFHFSDNKASYDQLWEIAQMLPYRTDDHWGDMSVTDSLQAKFIYGECKQHYWKVDYPYRPSTYSLNRATKPGRLELPPRTIFRKE